MKCHLIAVSLILVQLLCRPVHVTSIGCDDVLTYTDCTCKHSIIEVKVNCSGLGLASIPKHLPNQRFSIDFSKNLLEPKNIHEVCKYELLDVSLASNHLSQLPDNQFKDCRVMETLDLSNNPFEKLTAASLAGLGALQKLLGLESVSFQPRMFFGLTSLKHLNIVIRQSVVPADLFGGMGTAISRFSRPKVGLENLEMDVHGALNLSASLLNSLGGSLETLILTSCTLQWLQADQLASLHKLRNFELSSSSLSQIPHSLFSGNTNLRSISLTGIASIPRNIFTNLDNLRTLKLKDVNDMPSELFKDLYNLQTLEVSHCMLYNIPDGWLQDLHILEYLVFTENGLSELSQESFKNLNSLKVLVLSGNEIRELKAGVFAEVIDTVESVDLSNNEFQVIYPGNFAGAEQLTKLDLSRNMIHTLRPGAFTDLTELRSLNLTANKLTSVQADVFATNTRIIELYMADNMLSVIPDGLFAQMNNLNTLDLSRNNLHNLGLYSHLYPVRGSLDFSGNNIACDCRLYDFLQTLSYRHLYGECYRPDSSFLLLSDLAQYTSCTETSSRLTLQSSSSHLHTSQLTSEVGGNVKSGKNITADTMSHSTSSMEDTIGVPQPNRWTEDQRVRENITVSAESSVKSDTVKTSDEPSKYADGLSSDRNKTDNTASEMTTPGNATGKEIIIYNRVTEGTHRMAIIFIVGVTVVCAVIIILLALKRRRRSRYDITRALSECPDDIALGETESRPLHNVPSITIEKVDAMDNVKEPELYEP